MYYLQALILLFTQALCQHSALKPTSSLHHPHISVVNKNVTVVAGETAILPCSVDYLGTYKVVWVRGGKTLTLEDRRIVADDRVSMERPFIKEWNLHIRKVETMDAGVYMCQINTDPIQVRSVTLVVHEPPSIIDLWSTPTSISVEERTHVDLVCNVTGIPPPIVSWNRISTGQWPDLGPAGSKTLISTHDGAVLVLPNITRYCDDIYECVAFNEVAPAATREIRVQVQFAPEVTLATKKMGQVKGKGTVLDCEVVANPHNLSGWRRNGKELTKSTNHYVEAFNEKNKIILNLKINSVQEADYGEYECYAENLLGSDSEKMILHETPSKYTTTTTTARPELNPDIDHYSNGQHSYNNGQSHRWRPDNEEQTENDERNDYGLQSSHRNPDPSYNHHLKNNQGKQQVPAKSSVISDPKNRNTASILSAVNPLNMFAILVSIFVSSR